MLLEKCVAYSADIKGNTVTLLSDPRKNVTIWPFFSSYIKQKIHKNVCLVFIVFYSELTLMVSVFVFYINLRFFGIFPFFLLKTFSLMHNCCCYENIPKRSKFRNFLISYVLISPNYGLYNLCRQWNSRFPTNQPKLRF